MLKTVEELMLETTEALTRRGVEFKSNEAVTLEENLVAAQELLEKTPVFKNNGIRQNTPMTEVKEKDPMYARLVESFQSLGMTEKEARIAAMSDEQFADSNFQEQHGYLYNEK